MLLVFLTQWTNVLLKSASLIHLLWLEKYDENNKLYTKWLKPCQVYLEILISSLVLFNDDESVWYYYL